MNEPRSTDMEPDDPGYEWKTCEVCGGCGYTVERDWDGLGRRRYKCDTCDGQGRYLAEPGP